jgi:hypothetical protein
MIKSWSARMPKFTGARRQAGVTARGNVGAVRLLDRALVLDALAVAFAWLTRLPGRGTLAAYRARHRPLAGPPPGARLPQ